MAMHSLLGPYRTNLYTRLDMTQLGCCWCQILHTIVALNVKGVTNT